MTPTNDYLLRAEKHVRRLLDELRPRLLEAQGSIEHKLKDDKTVVTAMDMLVEERLRDCLAELDPGVGFGGEETGVNFDQKTFWLVDPIDGTDPFVRGLPFATTMLALIDNGEVIMSMIDNFALGEFYVAIKGQGASCNGHPIHVSDRSVDRAWVSLSARLDKQGVDGLYDALSREVKTMRRYGGAGFEYTQVARGALDGRVMFNGYGFEWDCAPGTLLVQEAGGRVANLDSDAYNYRDFNHIAANPVIFDDLMKFMVDWQNRSAG